jgi:hypothetical protein
MGEFLRSRFGVEGFALQFDVGASAARSDNMALLSYEQMHRIPHSL